MKNCSTVSSPRCKTSQDKTFSAWRFAVSTCIFCYFRTAAVIIWVCSLELTRKNTPPSEVEHGIRLPWCVLVNVHLSQPNVDKFRLNLVNGTHHNSCRDQWSVNFTWLFNRKTLELTPQTWLHRSYCKFRVFPFLMCSLLYYLPI